MVEPILYVSLGALTATLIGLMFLPFFWRRAVRLTTRQLINRLPVSLPEIVAAQDRLRAELAMAMRQTERRAERAMGDATRDRVDSARARSTELGHLADLADLRARLVELQSESERVQSELDQTGAEAASAYDALQESRAATEATAKELQAARQDASAARSAAEQAQAEAVARENELDALRSRLASLDFAPSPEDDLRSTFKLPRTGAAVRPAPLSTEAAADKASLAALRLRLDEVADQIVRASGMAASEPPAPQPHTSEAAAHPTVQRAPRKRLMQPVGAPESAGV